MSRPETLFVQHWIMVRVVVWLAGALMLLAGAMLYPPIAERLLSSDGQLAESSKRILFVAQIVMLAGAALTIWLARRFRSHSLAKERLVLGIAFGLSAIAGSLLLCEVGLRAAYGFRPLPASRHFFFLHDELLGWRHRPGAVALFKNTVVRINSAGWRDDERPTDGSNDAWRVMFLGDSQVFGDGVSVEDTFVQRLERELERVQAINAGVIGYGTDQQVLYLEQPGKPYHMDAAVLGLNAYDLRDNISVRVRSGYIKPRFDLIDGHLQLTNVPVPNGSVFDRAQRQLRTRSYTYTLVEQFLRKDEGLSRGGRQDPSTQVFPPTDQMDTALDLTAALLARLASATRSHNTRLAVAFLPYEMDFIGDRRYSALVDRLLESIEEAGRTAGFVVLDLRSELADGRGLYLDSMHFNAEGHRRVAAALKRLLVQHGLVPMRHEN